MTDLDDAVSALVDPVITRTPRGGDLPDHVAVHDCLLDQLEAAVTSSLSGRGGGTAAKNGRSVLNSDALYHAGLIRSHIGSWCRIAGVRSVRSNRTSLLAWANSNPADEVGFHAGMMRTWATIITNMLNPKGRFQYAVPCVACQATTWTDEEGAEQSWPLQAVYAKDDPQGSATVTCRACDATWEQEGIGELIEEVENTPQDVV